MNYFIIISIFSFITLVIFYKYIMQNDIITINSNRISTIDGLRGYLALSVFIHHFIINYYWHINGTWLEPEENWLVNIGEIPVSLFFMITGYLFSKKIFDNKFLAKEFLINRAFRIMPLYYIVISIMLFLTFIQTKFQIQESMNLFIFHILKWLLFTPSELNAFKDVPFITAGVTWTLKYEWIFYLFLPVFVYTLKNSKKIAYTLLIILMLICWIKFDITIRYLNIKPGFLWLFFSGFLVTIIEKNINLKNVNFDHFIVSIANIFILFFISNIFHTSNGLIPYILLTLFFLTIVFGNSLFGLLNLKTSKILGEISYSIYLIHGIILYTIFSIIFPNLIHDNTRIEYMTLFPTILMCILVISIFSYKYVEYPMILKGKEYKRKRNNK